jgi:hypothetical protein
MDAFVPGFLLLYFHQKSGEFPGNWISRLMKQLDFINSSFDKDSMDFKEWLAGLRMRDISFIITKRCHNNCFTVPSTEDNGFSHYACFRAITSDYIGIHHLISTKSLDSKKAILIISGAWRWTKYFLDRKEQLQDCNICTGRPDMDLPHLTEKCRITEEARKGYWFACGEEVSMEKITSNLCQEECVGRAVNFLKDVFDALFKLPKP